MLTTQAMKMTTMKCLPPVSLVQYHQLPLSESLLKPRVITALTSQVSNFSIGAGIYSLTSILPFIDTTTNY